MKSIKKASKKNNKENERDKTNSFIDNIGSNYILSYIYDLMTKKKKLEIVKYNKKLQNKLNLSIKDYKEFSHIENIQLISVILFLLNFLKLIDSIQSHQ